MRKSIVKSVVSGLALAGLLLCGSARAQIALQDGNTALATSVNIATVSKTNFTVTADASVLVVSLVDRNNESGNKSPATLAWGSQTLTRVVSVNGGTSTFFDANIYYLFNPTPGVNTITATDASGMTPSAMVMQAYTLSGVDTTVLPTPYSTSNTSATTLSVTLAGGTPAWTWASVCSAYATANLLMNLTSTGGTMAYAETNDAISEALGYVANLPSGSSTITANAGTGAGTGKMALGAAVFSALFAGPAAPTGLTATAQQNQVAVSWTDASGGVATGYVLWRSTASGSGFTAIATNTGNASVTYTDTGVTDWTTYYYLVQALDASGASTFSTQASATPFGISAAPTGLAAVGYATQAAVSWNASAGANTYNVLRSTTSGSGYTSIATALTSPYYQDSGLVNGTTYYYVVQAVNTYGTSANSAQAIATPQPLPAQTGVIAVQDGALNSGIVHIEAGSNPTISPPTISKTVTVTPGADLLLVPFYIQYINSPAITSDLTPATLAWEGQTLTKAIGEVNTANSGIAVIYYLFNPIPGTHSISFTDTTGKPVWQLAINAYTLNNVDTTITPTALGNKGANVAAAGLSVTYPSAPFGAFVAALATSRNGSPTRITSTTGTTNYQYIATPATPNSSFAQQNELMGGVLGLVPGSDTITSGDTGSGTPQTLATALFAPVLVGPSTPINLTATGQQNQIALSWTDNSGGTATSYIISRSTTSGSSYVAIATNSGNANVTYTDTSVVNYTTYYYVVQAANASGTSPFSNEASAFGIGSPTVPTGLAAVGFGTQVALTWTGQPSADSYNVLRSTTSGSGYTLIASGVTTAFYTDSGLTTGTTYYYVVNSQNSLGTSANSAEASATPQPVPPPTGQIAVQDGSLTVITNATGLTLSAPVTVTPGANALMVLVYDSNGMTNDTSPASLTWRDQTLQKMNSQVNTREANYCAVYTLADPEPSTGVITITDTSGAAANAVSMAMQVYTLSGVNNNDTVWPGPQAGGSVNNFAQVNTGVFDTFTSVPVGSFAVVSAMGGQNAANSEHISSTNGGTVTFATKVIGNDDVAMGGVANLPGGNITIAATNNAGGIAGTVVVGMFSPLILGPSAPFNLVATGETNQIALSWADSSVGAATGYVVLRSTTSGSGYVAIATNSGNANVTYTDTSVVNYTPYYYVVDAIDSAGSSAPSTEASAFAVGSPATPTGFSAVWGNNLATLNWNASSNATSYNILRSLTSGSGFTVIASTGTPGYVDATAVNFTTYYYEVNAANTNGTSADTAQIGVTPAPAPAQITVLDGSVTTMIDEDTTGVSSISTNFTVPPPGASVLIVSLYDQNNQASDLSPATLSWGSQTLTKCVAAYNSRALADSDIYYLFNPAPGTQTITATDTSPGPVYAMAMQVYTLSGVDTNQAVAVYSGSQQFAQSIPLTLSSATPAEAWAVVNAAAGNNTLNTTSVTSTSGTASYTDTPNPGVPNFVGQDVLMGGVADLAAGTGTITATNIAGGISFSSAVAVFAPAGALQTANTPTILPPQVDATGTNLVVKIATQSGHNYYLLSTPSLTPPVVWTTVSVTAGTGAVITNLVPIMPNVPGLFLQYRVQ